MLCLNSTPKAFLPVLCAQLQSVYLLSFSSSFIQDSLCVMELLLPESKEIRIIWLFTIPLHPTKDSLKSMIDWFRTMTAQLPFPLFGHSRVHVDIGLRLGLHLKCHLCWASSSCQIFSTSTYPIFSTILPLFLRSTFLINDPDFYFWEI